MDVIKLLGNVNNVDDYINATQVVINMHSNPKIQFNVSTVLVLKKLRPVEVEYFAKCNENGAALKIFELMLQLTPSKSLSLLGKELILLIQYWLDAIRRHLIIHNNNWWIFLKVLLKFIQDIKLKCPTLNDILIEEIAECLLDLATKRKPNIDQKHKIVCCLNNVCMDSNREIRLALNEKFSKYFVKLSTIMASCGDLCTQYSIMETLMRWLLPRQDSAVRQEASAKWFPSTLYCDKAVSIFLKRTWVNFFQDARDFLNAHNEKTEHITSVLCRKLFVGNVKLIYDTRKLYYYIDLNCGSKTISLMLDLKLLESLGSSRSLCDTLVIHEDNTSNIQMSRKSSEIIISLTIMDPLKMHSSNKLKDNYDVTIAIDPRSDVIKVNRALRNIFNSKYQLLMEIEEKVHSTHGLRKTSEDESKTSDFVNIQGERQSGYIVRHRNNVSLQSPSTASTSSLVMLKEKLSAFPGCCFKEKKINLQAIPNLSSVSELRSGVCYKENDNKSLNINQNDNDSPKSNKKLISHITNNDDNSISCLLAATIGSTNNSVIKRLSKRKNINTDNIIIDLLAQEALNSRNEESFSRTTLNDEELGYVIENTQFEKGLFSRNKIEAINNSRTDKVNSNLIQEASNILNVKKSVTEKNNLAKNKKTQFIEKHTIISNTTTDESNVDVVEDTPNVINIKGSEVNNSGTDKVNQTHDIQAADIFFSQYIFEKQNSENWVISPTLAKEINKTSSESSESLENGLNLNNKYDFNETEVLECLTDMIDKVCKNLERCTEYFNKDLNISSKMKKANRPMSLKKNLDNEDKEKTERAQKRDKGFKLNFTKSTRLMKQKDNLINETVNPVTEDILQRECVKELNDIGTKKKSSKTEKDDYNTSFIKRKRKLYSLEDDNKINEVIGIHISETEDDTGLSTIKISNKKPKSVTTSRQKIKNIRRNSSQRIRNKKLMEPSLSPKTKKRNDAFDKVKTSKDDGEKIILANKKNLNNEYTVYNFSSDSGSEDIKKQKIKINNSCTTREKLIKTQTSRRGRKPNKVINEKIIEKANKKNAIPKNTHKDVKKTDEIQALEPEKELIDERMRVPALDTLNTSLDIEVLNNEIKEPSLAMNKEPKVEIISEENENKGFIQTRKYTNPKYESLKNKSISKNVHQDNKSESETSLPGLIIEKAQVHKNAENSITADIILEKFTEICQNIELNTTQNLLLHESNSFSPTLNIAKESNNVDKSEMSVTKKNTTMEKTKHSKNYTAIDKLGNELNIEVTEKQKKNLKKNKSQSTRNKTATKNNDIKSNIEFVKKSKENSKINKSKTTRDNTAIRNSGNESDIDFIEKLNGNLNKNKSTITINNTALKNSSIEFKDKPTESQKNNRSKITGNITDIEKIINESNVELNIEIPKKNLTKNKPKGSAKVKTEKGKTLINVSNDKQNDILNISETTEATGMSIPTLGKSPITAHGAVDETPPNSTQLNEFIPGRGLETQYLNKDLKQYHEELSEGLNEFNVRKKYSSIKITDSRYIKENNSIESSPITQVCKSPSVSITRLSSKEINRYLPPRFNSIFGSNHSDSDSSIQKCKTYSKTDKTLNNLDKSSKKSPTMRKSIISPIKMYEEKSFISHNIEPIKIMTTTKTLKPQNTKYNLRSGKQPSLSSQKSSGSQSSVQYGSHHDNYISIAKRKSSSPISEVIKKKKVEDNLENLTKIKSTCGSSSSIQDWFKRNDSEKHESQSQSLKDVEQLLMEKLTTTLQEIHHATSKNFVDMFVDAQKSYDKVKEDLREMYKDTFYEIFTLMKNKFEEIDRKSKEFDILIENQKERSRRIIADDYDKKRLMVTLLQEDLQAVVKHLQKED